MRDNTEKERAGGESAVGKLGFEVQCMVKHHVVLNLGEGILVKMERR